MGESVGENFVAHRRQPGPELTVGARSVHQVTQQQGRPPAGDGTQGDLDRAVMLGTPGLSPVIRDEVAIPRGASRLVSGEVRSFAALMRDDVDSHPARITLTREPGQHPAVFAAAFNSGDPTAVEQVYEEHGVLVPEPGSPPVSGLDRAAANAGFQSLGVPIEVNPRHVYVADDIALLIVDWTIEGTGDDGQRVRIGGTATDVARRGADGRWRYVIDNPFGTA
jgi:ketosteroid isomerase-like protein